MLSRREEIAVAILVVCARNKDGLARNRDAARAADASPDQTAQVVHTLMRAGLINTVQGRCGGMRLARPAAQITLEQVIEAAGSKSRAATEADDLQPGSPLAAIARAAQSRARQTFESFTIADLVSETVNEKLTCLACSIRLRALERVATPGPSFITGPASGGDNRLAART